MTTTASAQIKALGLTATRGRRVAFLALMLGLAAGAAQPAAAGCSGTELRPVDMVSLGGSSWQVGYACYNNCGVQDTSARVIEDLLLIGRDQMLTCRQRCSAHSDCYGVSYHDTIVYVEGRAERARVCRLYGRGELRTVDTRSSSPMDAQVVCHRIRDQRDPWQKGIDTRVFQQDQFRPGVPGAGVPFNPKRP